MLKLDNISIWVHDQDEALAFYTDKLGFEVTFDITIDSGFRWLEIALPGHDTGLVLGAIPGGATMDDATEQQLRSLVGKGLSGTILLTTEDCYAEAEQLRARGIEFIQEPTDEFYGIDAAFRDPSGNHIRLTQPKVMAPT